MAQLIEGHARANLAAFNKQPQSEMKQVWGTKTLVAMMSFLPVDYLSRTRLPLLRVSLVVRFPRSYIYCLLTLHTHPPIR